MLRSPNRGSPPDFLGVACVAAPRGGDTVKKVQGIAILLIGLFGLTVQIHAAPQEGGPEIKQKVSTTAKKAAAQAEVRYQGSPQFASIPGTSITCATNAPQAVLHIGDAFYMLFTYFNPIMRGTQDVWLVSASAQGPWVPAHSVPKKATAIVCGQISTDPSKPYQLCTLPQPA